MENNKFTDLKKGVQEIIDLIGDRNGKEASNKLVEVSEVLDELMDYSEDDEDLREISRYQVLLNQLHQSIVTLDGQI
ncbi:MAG: CRISPR/Cas system CSM-associated protein Csm2 small subunit [Flavobacterium sp.]|jgi:CRISPR/Cas system CSM-associated protein Csm2 small subunit